MKVQPLTPIIGAEVSGLDLCHLTDRQFDGLSDAFTEHSVLFFRDQNAMAPADQVAFAKRFGPLHTHPAAPTLAEQLGRRPDMLDRLIDASALDAPGSVEELASQLRGGETLEDKLDRVRRVVGEMRFALGVQLLGGVHDALDVAAGYARIAEAAITVVTDPAAEKCCSSKSSGCYHGVASRPATCLRHLN